MQEKPKEPIEEKEKPPEKDGNWEEDQKKRGYYYDDAHGYEIFTDENTEETEEDVASSPAA